MKYTITEEIIKKAEDFAKASIGTNKDKYARRNQFDAVKILKDITVGKIGEEIVHQHLVKTFPKLSKPDYKIYEKFDKSWDSDLKDPETNTKIGVKSQNYGSSLLFGESWVFQYNDNKDYDCDTEVFKSKTDNHFMAFTLININAGIAEIKGIVKTAWLHKHNMFKEMKKQSLRGNKLAVYYKDLEGKDLFQLGNK